jgi:hypothetical protein
MRLYLFISRVERSLRAFTPDETGRNLPDERGPWYAAGSGSIISTGGDVDKIQSAVLQDGYLLLED